MLNLTIEECRQFGRQAYTEGDTLKAHLYDTIEYFMREADEAQEALESIRDILTKKGY